MENPWAVELGDHGNWGSQRRRLVRPPPSARCRRVRAVTAIASLASGKTGASALSVHKTPPWPVSNNHEGEAEAAYRRFRAIVRIPDSIRCPARAIADTNMKLRYRGPRGPLLSVLILFVVVGILAQFFAPRYCCGPGPSKMTPETIKKTQDETIKKIQGCIDHWRSECDRLRFTFLNGIEKRDLTQRLPASAFMPPAPDVVCEEDASAEHCTRVHWGND
jgi:hypothetical protein